MKHLSLTALLFGIALTGVPVVAVAQAPAVQTLAVQAPVAQTPVAQTPGVQPSVAQTSMTQPSVAQISMTLADERAFDCVMDPSLRANLGSQVPGLLAEVLVRRGDHVHAGQVVARLVSEVETAQVALDQLRASSTAEIEAREAQLTLAQRELGRTEELFKRQVATAQHLDELRAQAAVSDRELSLARQVRQATQLELLRSEAYLRQREIRSPFDGLVTDRLMSAGEYVHPEAVILRLAQLDPLYVETYLPVRLFPLLHAGLEAAVEPADPIGGTIQARVSVVDQVFDAASGTFGVQLEVPNRDGRLPAGHRCKVSFRFGEVSALVR
jgi:RND family efflux transporter MFP subunit